MEKTHTYAKGNWIVHIQYGIGQIKGVDVKGISGQETDYYRIEASNSTFWVPVQQMDSELLRPLSTSEEIEQAIAALQSPPKEMSSNYKIRQNRIREARTRNTPQAIAQLVRDLRAFKKQKGVLNKTERSAFQVFKQRLVEEWAVVTGSQTESVASTMNSLLEALPAPEPQRTAVVSS